MEGSDNKLVLLVCHSSVCHSSVYTVIRPDRSLLFLIKVFRGYAAQQAVDLLGAVV